MIACPIVITFLFFSSCRMIEYALFTLGEGSKALNEIMVLLIIYQDLFFCAHTYGKKKFLNFHVHPIKLLVGYDR